MFFSGIKCIFESPALEPIFFSASESHRCFVIQLCLGGHVCFCHGCDPVCTSWSMSDQSANKSNNPDKADPPPEQRQRLIIDGLQAPPASDLARKREFPCNLQHSGKRFVYPKGTSNPNVTWVFISVKRNFQKKASRNLQVHYFFTGCREEVELKRTVIQQHIKSSKHSRGKEKLAVKPSVWPNVFTDSKKYALSWKLGLTSIK